jgi:hypothetical protein
MLTQTESTPFSRASTRGKNWPAMDALYAESGARAAGEWEDSRLTAIANL